ncbi:UNVERIFIED_CONTAM: hypothetical protein FKN15_036256 [Acipenser sinensis]
MALNLSKRHWCKCVTATPGDGQHLLRVNFSFSGLKNNIIKSKEMAPKAQKDSLLIKHALKSGSSS